MMLLLGLLVRLCHPHQLLLLLMMMKGLLLQRLMGGRTSLLLVLLVLLVLLLLLVQLQLATTPSNLLQKRLPCWIPDPHDPHLGGPP